MPVTFFVVLPLIHVIVFLAATAVAVSVIFAVAETGARVEVPAWVAVTEQFPPVSRFKVDPVIEQIPVEVVE